MDQARTGAVDVWDMVSIGQGKGGLGVAGLSVHSPPDKNVIRMPFCCEIP